MVTISNSAFRDCLRLKTINFPPNLKLIGTSAFGCCYLLKKVSFNRCMKLKTIKDYSFSETSLEKVVLPKCLKESDLKAFKYCPFLSKVTFQEWSRNVSLVSFERWKLALESLDISLPKSNKKSIKDSLFIGIHFIYVCPRKIWVLDRISWSS